MSLKSKKDKTPTSNTYWLTNNYINVYRNIFNRHSAIGNRSEVGLPPHKLEYGVLILKVGIH